MGEDRTFPDSRKQTKNCEKKRIRNSSFGNYQSNDPFIQEIPMDAKTRHYNSRRNRIFPTKYYYYKEENKQRVVFFTVEKLTGNTLSNQI